MSEQTQAIATVPGSSLTTAPEPKAQAENLVAIAARPEEMFAAQSSLIRWATGRLDQAKQEEADLRENVEIAKKNKWGLGGLQRAYSRAVKTTEYYEKILAALAAGFVLVPNFPVELFAIRTCHANPRKGQTLDSWDRHEQSSESPPVGEGAYVSPLPEIWQRNLGKRDRSKPDKDIIEYFAKRFRGIEFPFNVAKPVILDATERAMALKCFDSIGALPGAARAKGDPIIVGQIELAGRQQFNRRFVTFMIAWFVDTREL
jgi:hypothetical protein